MKTAISVPDPIFKRVERHAARLGVSRSEFFSRAAAQYADELEAADRTAAIDAALDAAGHVDQGVAFVRRAAARQFDRNAW